MGLPDCQVKNLNEVEIRVRRATPADAETVIGGINTICTEGGAFYTTHFSPSAQWENVLYRPERVPDHLLLVAEKEDEFIGACRLFPGQEHTLFRHVAELGIFVLKPYRNQGVGARLMMRALDWAERAGLEKITLCVFATNTPAIRLYRKFAFVVEGRQRRQLRVNGKYVDLLLMARFLDREIT